MLRFGQDAGFRFDGNVGVRIIRTETGATGAAVRVAAPATACGPTTTPANCALITQAMAFAGGNIASLTQSQSGSYTDVLPSLNLRFFLNDQIQLRLAAAKAIVRPTFAQLNPFTTLGFSFDSATGAPNGVGVGGRTTAFTGTAGNPDLKPTR